MEFFRLGNTGVKVSRLCLGCMTYGAKSWREWVLEEPESQPFLEGAMEAGINFFDTANMYSLGRSEEILGNFFRRTATPRSQVVLATKVYHAMGSGPNDKGLSRKHIVHSAEESLRRLQTDYIDLYQIHRLDHETPMEEILEALHQLVQQGKVLYLGASSMYAWQFAKLRALAGEHGWAKFVSMQNHYNLVYREEEREMMPYCRSEGVALIPWSPLARGFLAGNRTKADYGDTVRAKTDNLAQGYYYQESDFAIVERVREIAAGRGISPAMVALAWVLRQPGITAPIIGASKMPQLEEALAALTVHLTDEEDARLRELYQPHAVLGHV